MRKQLCILALGLAGASASFGTAAGETVTYKGTGTYAVVRALLPLANGGAALQLVNKTVATIEPSESGFMDGDCAGLGYLSAAGETTLRAMCSFELSAADGFVIQIDGDPKSGATVQVLGGRGKFHQASGTGKVKRKFLEGNKGSYEYEFAITTP
jgi:hypothetical protein